MFAPYPFREHDHRNNALPLTLPSIVRPGCKNEERTEIEKEKERKREKERERISPSVQQRILHEFSSVRCTLG